MHEIDWLGRILSDRQPMEPIETDVQSKLQPLHDVRVVVFDVYGTLVISGSGDVGSADMADRGTQIAEALQEVGIESFSDLMPTAEILHQEIRESNDRRRNEDCPAPEVDIVDIWRSVLRRCGVATESLDPRLPVRLAVAYEARANPTWPMPGAKELLRRLSTRRLALGIVSNAQVFTPWLVSDLTGAGNDRGPCDQLREAGFDLDLCAFSNRFRQSKPGPRLFDVVLSGLERKGMRADQAVYVGNDMLNDVWAASRAGMRTAWFVGDLRSCRPRGDDPRCQSLEPDVIIRDPMQLLDCLEMQ